MAISVVRLAKWIGAILIVLVGAWLVRGLWLERGPAPVEGAALPSPPVPTGHNGLSDEERSTYYHLSEGGELFPIDWLLALETIYPAEGAQPAVRRPFLDNIERYAMLPDPKGPGNPYGLPVGVTYGRSRLSGQMMIGLNCTACHVGQWSYQGHAVRVDGAPSMAFINRFIIDMAQETERTIASPRRLARFWRRVREARAARRELGAAGEVGGEEPAPDEGFWSRMRELFTQNRGMLRAKIAALRNVGTLKAAAQLSPLDGYGRADAFGVGRNELFGSIPLNAMPADAPVSFPHTWGIKYTGWLQWGANTNSVMERNIGQALGVGAVFDPATFRSSVRLENLHRMETLTYKLTPPTWPTTWPAIDTVKAERGRTHFVGYCAPCHQTYQMDGAMRIYQLFALDEVGTDPNTALNFEKPVRTADGRILPFPTAALELIKGVKNEGYRERGFTAEQIAEWEERDVRRGPEMEPTFRLPLREADQWPDTRGRKVYRAKTLVGIWATPPYLHNGSVPTIYDLLLPAAQRPRRFPVGQPEYDPVKLGIETDPARFTRPPGAVPFELDTSLAGNWNSGHEWHFYPDLDDTQRYEIIEFLKMFTDEAQLQGLARVGDSAEP